MRCRSCVFSCMIKKFRVVVVALKKNIFKHLTVIVTISTYSPSQDLDKGYTLMHRCVFMKFFFNSR